MSSSPPTPASSPSFESLLRPFLAGDGLPFADALSAQEVQSLADQEGVDFGSEPDCVYTPAVTLWAWLSQALSDSQSCVAAVARVLVLRAALHLPPCSAATGACRVARSKLPERFLQRLALQVGTEVERQAPDGWRRHGRRVLLVDGSECSLPDTPANQAAYPQNGAQKPGLGFPLIRLVVLLTFATAALVGAAVGPSKGKETGETALFREVLEALHAGDVVVADRCCCSSWLIALLTLRGVDGCFRLHQSRQVDYRKAKRLGRDDHPVTWERPRRPDWMDQETCAGLPPTLALRLVRARVSRAGFRTEAVDVVTTLVDAREYPKEEVGDLCHKRWHVGLDIRALEQTSKMDVLTCKAPEMVRKEIWVHLPGYNLVRRAAAQAALAQGKQPRRLSFAGAKQTLNAFRRLLLLHPEEGWERLGPVVWLAISTHEVGDRPDRCEPREKKRRPNGYPKLKKPRRQRRAELLGAEGRDNEGGQGEASER